MKLFEADCNFIVFETSAMNISKSTINQKLNFTINNRLQSCFTLDYKFLLSFEAAEWCSGCRWTPMFSLLCLERTADCIAHTDWWVCNMSFFMALLFMMEQNLARKLLQKWKSAKVPVKVETERKILPFPNVTPIFNFTKFRWKWFFFTIYPVVAFAFFHSGQVFYWLIFDQLPRFMFLFEELKPPFTHVCFGCFLLKNSFTRHKNPGRKRRKSRDKFIYS